ncbi:MAG: PEP-CTERM sorting domain-containing protein [Pirellulales bacterium]|nr:PEP-CTERM sorting domain-containing protein [Pirellulales bacterium]
MNAIKRIVGLLSLVAAAALTVSPAFADPLPGRDLPKFTQQPMLQHAQFGQIYFGHDELSTAYRPFGPAPTLPYRGRFMADDFADNYNTPVVHVKFWGSYMNTTANPNPLPVTKFLIAFEADQPAGPPGPIFSHPIPPIQSEIVTLGALSPGSGTFTEKQIHPGGAPLNEAVYEYNAELAVPFNQKADTIYWLKIVALVDLLPGQQPTDPNVTRWGWHNREYGVQNVLASPNVAPGENQQGNAALGPIWHFQDNAVEGAVNVFTGIDPNGVEVVTNVDQPIASFSEQFYRDNIDGPQGISNFSKDLAFELYTVPIPEPATCLLMVAGLAGIVACRRSRRG